jgi:diguanylate cyclase (GGDEF)-like protein
LAGDEILQRLAGELHGNIRKRDLLARLDGDEFGMLMERRDLRQAEHVAGGLRDAVATSGFTGQKRTIPLT